MLTWLSSDASFASRTNDLMKLASSARCGSNRLRATTRSNPSTPRSSARCTVAIPPTPSRSYTRYGPNGSSTAGSAAMTPGIVRVARNPDPAHRETPLSRLVGGLHVERQRVDRALHFVGEGAHHDPVALHRRLACKPRGNHQRLPVIGGAGEILELDVRVGQGDPDLRDDVVGFHLTTPSSRPTCANAVIARSISSSVCAADSWTRIRAWPFGTTGNEKPIT